MSAKRFTGKTESDAVMNAAMELGIPSTDLKYTVIDREVMAFLGCLRNQSSLKLKKKN